MKKVSHKAPKVKAIHKDDATPETPLEEELGALDTRIALIQALIPLGLDAVAEELQNEVTRLAGDRYTRKDTQNPNRRWGSQQGSVYLSDQKVPLSVPRVRDVEADEEVSLQTYHHLQRPRRMDEGLLMRMIKSLPRNASIRGHCHARLSSLCRDGAGGLWAIFIHRVETLYQGVGTKAKTVSRSVFSAV